MGNPDSDAAVGVGAFNLVRRTALEKTEGFEWLRMEVADDVGLALMLKRSGAKSFFAVSLRDISIVWYPSLRAMFTGLEKNLFGAGAHYSFIRMTGIFIFLWIAVLAPVTAILYPGIPYLWILGATVYLFAGLAALIGKLRFGWEFIPSLLTHAGLLILSLMLVRSGIMCALRHGISWRGTVYPLDELRAGQRVKL